MSELYSIARATRTTTEGVKFVTTVNILMRDSLIENISVNREYLALDAKLDAP